MKTFSGDENLALSYRVVSGAGGFAAQGSNLAASYQRKFGANSNLYVEVGSPAAQQTLHRVILKYVQFIGSGVGE